MELPALELRPALEAAATRVAEALRCEKVDAFLFDEAHQTLRATGTSRTPMGDKQKALGLDVLALANGGRTVEVFESGVSHIEHHAERDGELRGLVDELGVRATLNVAFDVNGVRRGVLAAASARPEFFEGSDLKFLEIVARWVGALVARAELTELARRAEAENARRNGAEEIITVLAHDLRNLLQPLLARLQVMRIRLENGNNVSISDIDRGLQSMQRLSALTDDLLDLKRLEDGLFGLKLDPVDFACLATETAAYLGATAGAVRVTGESKLVGVADGARVRQALENLVANAVKYSPEGKPVEVRVTREEQDGRGWAVLEVLDVGPGIAPAVALTLFDKYAASPDSKGLGLGLYLAHGIARVHGGELSVHPRSAGGTRFRLRLPLEPAEIIPRIRAR